MIPLDKNWGLERDKVIYCKPQCLKGENGETEIEKHLLHRALSQEEGGSPDAGGGKGDPMAQDQAVHPIGRDQGTRRKQVRKTPV